MKTNEIWHFNGPQLEDRLRSLFPHRTVTAQHYMMSDDVNTFELCNPYYVSLFFIDSVECGRLATKQYVEVRRKELEAGLAYSSFSSIEEKLFQEMLKSITKQITMQHNVHASTNFVDNWESKCAERHRQQAQDISDEYIIGSIWTTDGHLVTKFHDGKYYWALQHYNPYKWEEIPVSLFLELDKFQRSLDRKGVESCMSM